MVAIDRLVLCFFALFLSVYFLESIGGFYMTSAIVSIEKQFQIPSKISGMMVSAGDFGYIPSVVFVAYLGSKGNRARWIGGGCTLIAIANMLISSSNFLFPGGDVRLNTSTVEQSLERDIHRLPGNLSLAHFLAHIPEPVERERMRARFTSAQLALSDPDPLSWLDQLGHCLSENGTTTPSLASSDPACFALYGFLHEHNAPKPSEVTKWRLLSATSYAFCDKSLNTLRSIIDEKRCGQEMSSMGPTVTIFLGLLILGIGRTMPFSLGLPLIDDNVRKANLPLYFAGMFCIRIMGPMLGFLMGSFFNKLYYIVGEAPHGMTPRDPLWIGRWWAGFLAIGSVLLLPSLALFFFRNPKEQQPRRASDAGEGPDGKQRPRGLALVDRHLEKGEDGEAVVPKGVFAKGADFAQTMSTVIRQPVYRWAMAGRIIDVFAFKGFHIFMPKYLELQFGIPQYEVNRLMGVIGVLAFAVGVLIGSLVMRGAKLQGRKAASWVAVTGAVAACFSLLNSFVGCKSTMTALGESLSGNKNFGMSAVGNACMVGCDCTTAPLYPVCDTNGTVYYSPCHAGCPLSPSAFAILNAHKTPVFDGCACAGGGQLQQVSREFCQDGNCRSMLYWYFTNMAIGGIVGGMGVVPGVLIMLRSVPPKHRSISLGFNGFLVSLLATLPSPIVWGAIIDHFCLFWTQKCGERGACALYATDGLQFWMHIVYGGLRIVSLITDLFVIYHAVGLKLTDSEAPDPDGDEDGNNKKSEQYTGNDGKSDPEQAEALLRTPKSEAADGHRHVSCAPPSYDELPGNKKGPTGGGHRRNASRDMSSLVVPPVGTEELEVFRKSSSHIGGPIAEY